MRSFFVLLFLFSYMVIMLPLHLILLLIGKFNLKLRFTLGYYLVKFGLWCELRIAGCKLTVLGKENIPKETALFVSNHQSYFDILVTQTTVGRPMGFVSKKEMLKLQLLAWYMKDIGCVFLDRDDPREGLKTINQGAEYMKMGHSMIIFPEGTRSKCDDMAEFKEGSLKMAQKAKTLVVPVAIVGTNRLLEIRPGFDIRKGKVTVIYGKPFDLKDVPEEYKRKPAAYTQHIIQTMIDEYNKEVS